MSFMDEILPLIPHGATIISNNLTVIRDGEQWTYFHGGLPIFSHASDDKGSFRGITSSFIVQGICRNSDIIKVFNVSKTSVIRNIKKYKSGGLKSFFLHYRRRVKNSAVITEDIVIEAEELLSNGFTRGETAKQLSVKYDTLCKAIKSGRIVEKKSCDVVGSNKSERSTIDINCSDVIGTACTNIMERTLCAFGVFNNIGSNFQSCIDLSNGGVLIALPALEANGLYHHIKESFYELKGYYSVIHIITLLAFMALCRIKTVEQLRWQPPGEFGKLLGIDRIPEVRCLREKIATLSEGGKAQTWADNLSKKWMSDKEDLSGVLYVDGHIRLYSGCENIPKQYVSRERLCLKGSMDFWVNDRLGQPFFVVRKPVNHGMIEALKNNIVPRLLKEVPEQPDQALLDNEPYLHRFAIVFDREGYSPAFFKTMWDNHRISCMTYNKYPKEDWHENEFQKLEVELINGEKTEMLLAERGSYIGSPGKCIWVREIRKLTKGGHQTSIVTTAFAFPIVLIAVLMFARWCQENFFNYMMQEFAIDLLNDYSKGSVPDTEKVISPKWRCFQKRINSITGKLKNRKSRFTDFTLIPEIDTGTQKYIRWEKYKKELAEEIKNLEDELNIVKTEQKSSDKYIEFKDLNESDKFKSITPSSKSLIDTIKMIAYRAETSMASIINDNEKSIIQARSLLKDIFTSEADLVPDEKNKILNVHIHPMSTAALNKAAGRLIYSHAFNFRYPKSENLDLKAI